MKGKHVVATIAFILTAQCLPIPTPADAGDPVIAWQMQDRRWIPIMSFTDDASCARAASALADNAAYVRCAVAAPAARPQGQRQPLTPHATSSDVLEAQR